jgi:SepF-like predicted cell division protein (DUF552 family)
MSGNKYDGGEIELCNEIRESRKKGWSYELLNDTFESSCITEIISHVVGICDCNEEDETNVVAAESPSRVDYVDAREDEPWKEQYVVETLYISKGLRFTEMSDVMDCHSETAKKYVDIFNVSPVDSSKRTSSPRVNNLLRLGAETNGDIDIK